MTVKLIAITIIVFFISTVILLSEKSTGNLNVSEKNISVVNSEINKSHFDTQLNTSETDIKLLLKENDKLNESIADLKKQLAFYEQKDENNKHHVGDDPVIEEDNPLFGDLKNYQIKMQSEDMDEDWRHIVEPIIQKIRNSEQLEGTSLIASECRSTMCRLDFMMEEVDQSDRTESYLLNIFPEELNGSVKLQKVPYENGAMGMVVFYSRDGNFSE